MSNHPQRNHRRQALVMFGVIAALGAVAFLGLMKLGRGLFGPAPAAVCKTIAEKSSRNMHCYHRGGEVYGWQDLDNDFTVTGAGWELGGVVHNYSGEPLTGLDCTDRHQRFVMGFWQVADGPITGEPADAARELCALLGKQ